MRVHELIDILSDQPADAEVELAVIAPVDETSDDITVDHNHPLAGQTLNFSIEIVEVREATEEEQEHGHVHGPGGHQH